MRVLILTQHFAPEVTAGRFRVEAFAAGLAARGHRVRVICPVPNHPRGVVEPGYGQRMADRRVVDGVEVTYVRVAVATEKTLRTRLAYYGSYAALAIALGSVGGKPDLVLASSPPLTVATAGSLVARRYRRPLLLDIRDLWPDSALDLGELPADHKAVGVMRRLERRAYRGAAAIVTANDAFRDRILERSPPGTVVESVPNGTTPGWLEVGRSEVSRSAAGLPEGAFVWAYAGNIGLAHGLEHAADAARDLGDEFRLLVIGQGARRERLAELAARIPSLDLRDLMAPMDAARHLRAADALLVSERQESTISAKLYDVAALGRPIVAACRGELLKVVERERIALPVPHGDSAALADAVRRLRDDPVLGAELGERAQAFARSHLREHQAERVARLAESLITPP